MRALDILKSAELVLCEDTRVTRKLLSHYDIQTSLKAFHAHNEHSALPGILDILKRGAEVALVSDAGTPGISDPGFLLVRACLAEDIGVQCLPGATAFVPALIQSGFPCDRFYFEGFLPRKKGRNTRWKYLSHLDQTIILYESPYRILKCLEEIHIHFGPDRRVSISREMTKIHEEQLSGPAAEHISYFEENPDRLKGEFVLVIAPPAKSSSTSK